MQGTTRGKLAGSRSVVAFTGAALGWGPAQHRLQQTRLSSLLAKGPRAQKHLVSTGLRRRRRAVEPRPLGGPFGQ